MARPKGMPMAPPAFQKPVRPMCLRGVYREDEFAPTWSREEYEIMDAAFRDAVRKAGHEQAG